MRTLRAVPGHSKGRDLRPVREARRRTDRSRKRKPERRYDARKVKTQIASAAGPRFATLLAVVLARTIGLSQSLKTHASKMQSAALHALVLRCPGTASKKDWTIPIKQLRCMPAPPGAGACNSNLNNKRELGSTYELSSSQALASLALRLRRQVGAMQPAR